ncbi:NmrA family protein [Kribbella flavida DSM 17836]|uniref:NmrA family protein n=1 Tax=Kribbella flavida (strain DSM 17836 / JCM 10339 / NBRC 14399) TaxID=479435 RepID=D2PPL6_KRIFD|nr:NAD(P)H-binding protein [Kribbella flavida]ADB30978.1 NmrA family protein [Kribbella flavida DSM 17836]
MTFLVTGASGNAGGAVVRKLAERGIPGKALLRSERELPEGIELLPGDLNQPATFLSGLEGVSGIFLLSGYAGTEELLAGAKAAGVGRIVLLSSSSVVGTDTDNAIAAYHLATENAVRASGLDWTFLRPNTFMSNTLRWRDQLRAGDEVRVQYPEVAVSTIHPGDIADVAVRALTEDGHAGTAYRLTGPVAVRPAEQVAILAEALGRPLRAVELSREQSRAELLAAMPEPYATAIDGFFGDGIVDETTVTDTVERLTGRPAGTLQEWVAEHAGLFATS